MAISTIRLLDQLAENQIRVFNKTDTSTNTNTIEITAPQQPYCTADGILFSRFGIAAFSFGTGSTGAVDAKSITKLHGSGTFTISNAGNVVSIKVNNQWDVSSLLIASPGNNGVWSKGMSVEFTLT